MAAHHGRGGAVTVDAVLAGTQAALTEVTAWTYNDGLETTDAPAMGQTEVRTLGGLKSGEGTFACNYDDTDTEQEALDVGDLVELHLHIRGTGSGLPEYTSVGNEASGKVVIESVESAGDTGSVISRSYGFKNVLLNGSQPV